MRISIVIATFFYLGNIKPFPGTLASLATLILWTLFVPVENYIRFLFLLTIILLGFLSTKFALTSFKEKDPQSIVIDEVVGMSIPLFFILEDIILAFIAFFLFRIFDILKPSIIYYSQSLKGHYGVLFDDIIAGIITALIIINYT